MKTLHWRTQQLQLHHQIPPQNAKSVFRNVTCKIIWTMVAKEPPISSLFCDLKRTAPLRICPHGLSFRKTKRLTDKARKHRNFYTSNYIVNHILWSIVLRSSWNKLLYCLSLVLFPWTERVAEKLNWSFFDSKLLGYYKRLVDSVIKSKKAAKGKAVSRVI